MADIKLEVEAAREGAATLPPRQWGLLRVSGKDRLDFVHNYTTNEVKGLAPGRGCTSAISNWRGTVTDHVRILAFDEALLIVCTGGRETVVKKALEKFLIGVDVRIRDESAGHTLVEIVGPDVFKVLPAGTDLPIDGHLLVQMAPPLGKASPEHPSFLDEAETPDDDDSGGTTACILIRTWGVQGRGLSVLCRGSDEQPLRERLRRMRAIPIGREAWEAVRLQEGIPEFGRDIGEDTNVWEARLNRSVSLAKGCYLGQEIVARLYNYKKVQRYLMGASLVGGVPPAPATPILGEAGEALGIVTSSAAESDDRGRVLAMIKSDAAKAGTKVRIGDRVAELEDLPYWTGVLIPGG